MRSGYLGACLSIKNVITHSSTISNLSESPLCLLQNFYHECFEKLNNFAVNICVPITWASQVAQQVKNWPAMQETEETQIQSLGREDPMQELAKNSMFLPLESHGQRSLGNYSPEGPKESDMTEVNEHTFTYHLDAIIINNFLCLVYYMPIYYPFFYSVAHFYSFNSSRCLLRIIKEAKTLHAISNNFSLF